MPSQSELRHSEINSQFRVSDRQVAQSLMRSHIIATHDGLLEWGSALGSNTGVMGGYMHHPIAQLYGIYEAGGFTFSGFGQYEPTGLSHERPYLGLPLTIPEYRMNAVPSELLDHFMAREDTSRQLLDTLTHSKKVLLTGCVNPTSGIDLARKLYSYGFRGNLDVGDISEAPLSLMKHLYAFLHLEEELGIQLTTRAVDLRRIEYGNYTGNPWRDFDMVFSDVLGHYFSNDHFESHMAAILSRPLKPGGILLARDMGEFALLDDTKRHVTTIADKHVHRAQYRQWLADCFQTEVSMETLDLILDHLWPNQKHNERGMHLETMWNYSLTHAGHLKEVASDTVVPLGMAPDQRYFTLMMYQKPADLPQTNPTSYPLTMIGVDANFQQQGASRL